MKTRFSLLLIGLLWLPVALQAQGLFYTNSGHIWFFSSAPLEDIEAHNHKVVAMLDAGTGELVFSVPMKEFQFRKSLMQTHFNENYVESDKYPKAYFKGKVTNMQEVDLEKEADYKVRVKGVLTIHGRDKEIDTPGILQVRGRSLIGKAKFSITPQEFDIEIPRLVREHIAKQIDINVDVLLKPYTGKKQEL